MRRTLESVAAQTIPPAAWVVVDDGSTDQSASILAEYQTQLPYLRVVRRSDRGSRSVGPGVIEAFYDGLSTVDLDAFDYLCKLDLDLELPPRYFELLVARLEANPRLGTTSGKPYRYHSRSGSLVPEVCGDEHSVGASKFYRTPPPHGFVGHLIGAACPVEEEGVHDDEEGIAGFGGSPEGDRRSQRSAAGAGPLLGEAEDGGGAEAAPRGGSGPSLAGAAGHGSDAVAVE
jgi:glycosyltransferase involved in cell wall biosynthesis